MSYFASPTIFAKSTSSSSVHYLTHHLLLPKIVSSTFSSDFSQRQTVKCTLMANLEKWEPPSIPLLCFLICLFACFLIEKLFNAVMVTSQITII